MHMELVTQVLEKQLDEETLRLLRLEFPWLSLAGLSQILKQQPSATADGGAGCAGAASASSSDTGRVDQQ